MRNFDDSESGEELELVRQYQVAHRKNYLQRIKQFASTLVIKPESCCSICWEYFKETDEVVALECNE